MKQVIIACGSRDWDDYEAIDTVIGAYCGEFGAENITLIHGDARGADRMAARAAREWGVPKEQILARPANWDKYGKQAGRIRNLEMLVEALVLAEKSCHELNEKITDKGYHYTFLVKPTDAVYCVAFYKGEYSAGTQMMIDYAKGAGVFTEIYRPGDV